MTDSNTRWETVAMRRRPGAFLGMAALCTGAALLFALGWASYVQPSDLAPEESWWLMIVALGMAAIGASAWSRWRAAGFVAATFLLGVGAQLALKEPVWFQQLRLHPTSMFSYVWFAAVMTQATTAGLVLLRRDAFRQGARAAAQLGWLRVATLLLMLLAGVMGASNYISGGDYIGLIKQFVAASGFLVVNIMSFVALVLATPGEPAQRLGERLSRAISLPGCAAQVRRLDRAFPLWLAAGVFLFCVFGRLVVFDNTPRIDEVLYLFHARYFASGQLTLPVPEPVEAFQIFMMDVRGGRWFATWPPGWPAVLAIGVLLGAPWIVNPLLAAVTILLFHSFVNACCGRGLANLAAFLMAISPWFVWTASTLMSHTLTHALVLGAWVLLIRARSRASIIAPFAAGALLGLDFLTRPLEGVLIGVLTGLWLLTFLTDRRHWATVLLYGLGCLCVGGLVFPYNAALTGAPLQAPVNAYLDKVWGEGANRLGFGADVGAHPKWPVDPFLGHSPLESLVQFQHLFYALNFELLGWAVGSAAFALIFVLWGRWTKITAAMAVVGTATILAHALYWYAAFDYVGPRYWSLVLAPMLVLTAAGIPVCMARLHSLFPQGAAPQRIGVGLAWLSLCSVVVFSSWLGCNKYPDFRGYHDNYRTLARQPQLRNSLIFVTSDSRVEYENAFWLNDLSGASRAPIFARDLGEAVNRRVAESYPGRRIYFVAARTPRSGGRAHVEITRGPLGIGDLGPTKADPS